MDTIDLDCDLGEGGGFDQLLMPYISTCNIACGGHFGNKKTIAQTVNLAIQHRVKIGAHPSYPDQVNFGRKTMEMSTRALQKELKVQILAVKEQVERVGRKMHHVKPHGALYNDIVKDEEKAQIVVDTIKEIDDSLTLFVPPKSIVQKLAEGNLRTWIEGFVDRNYNPDFSLVSRQKDNAVLSHKEEVLNRIYSVVKRKEIKAINGGRLLAKFDTICMHSDTENSVEILQFLIKELPKKNIIISK